MTLENPSRRPRILIIEDSDGKYRSVKGVVDRHWQEEFEECRASTINEAEERVLSEIWDIVLLDISMDIAPSSAGFSARGHANLGGLSIANKMFLKRREMPTIIVTAHDAFEVDDRNRKHIEIVDLGNIMVRAREYLGDKFVGHVRYGDADWSAALEALLDKAWRP